MPDTSGTQTPMKEYRRNNPSGWLRLSRYPSVPFIIDAFLESRPSKEFSKTELVEKSGVSENSLRNYLPELEELGIVERHEGGGWPRYSFNERSRIAQKIIELNTIVSRIHDGDLDALIQAPKEAPSDRRTRRRDIGVDVTGTSRVSDSALNTTTQAAD